MASLDDVIAARMAADAQTEKQKGLDPLGVALIVEDPAFQTNLETYLRGTFGAASSAQDIRVVVQGTKEVIRNKPAGFFDTRLTLVTFAEQTAKEYLISPSYRFVRKGDRLSWAGPDGEPLDEVTTKKDGKWTHHTAGLGGKKVIAPSNTFEARRIERKVAREVKAEETKRIGLKKARVWRRGGKRSTALCDVCKRPFKQVPHDHAPLPRRNLVMSTTDVDAMTKLKESLRPYWKW